MSDAPEGSDVLSSVAGSIIDSTPVPWEEVAEQLAGDDDGAILEELRLLERIARFHQESQSEDVPQPPASATAALGENDPRRWAHFLILGRIGGGAFGDVYRAHDTKLQCDVALKLMRVPADSTMSPGRVLKEARHLARVQHANVVRVYGADQIDARVGLWMELVRGTTLEDLLRHHGMFGAHEAALVGLDLCRAVAAVHRAGLLHGDIKAHNVMREEGGRTVLMDFGAGKDLNGDLLRAQLGGQAGGTDDFAGTPMYLAPEVFAGSSRSTATDVYSLGVLLFHLVTNRYPVEGQTRGDLEDAHRTGARTHLRDVRPELPDTFVAIIERALDRDPNERFQSAGAFESALARFLGAPAENDQPAQSRMLTIGAAIAAIIIAAAGLPAYWWANHRAAPEATLATASVAGGVATEGSYTIDAALYRVTDHGDMRLRPGDRVAPGDRLALQLQVSRPTHVYVVDEDDMGESYLLFPLPDQKVTNPVPASNIVRLPASRDGSSLSWQVTSAGGQEHFLIFATPEPLATFDRMFKELPHPQLNAPVVAAPLTTAAVGLLRGVGGLTSSPARAGAATLAAQYTTPLSDTKETVRGVWVRQITLDNPR